MIFNDVMAFICPFNVEQVVIQVHSIDLTSIVLLVIGLHQ